MWIIASSRIGSNWLQIRCTSICTFLKCIWMPEYMHLCLWNYKLREGFRQISADTNCSIYLSGSRRFLPQSGPDVIWQADSCTETVKAIFAHNIVTSLYYHLQRSHNIRSLCIKGVVKARADLLSNFMKKF